MAKPGRVFCPEQLAVVPNKRAGRMPPVEIPIFAVWIQVDRAPGSYGPEASQ